MLGAVEERYEWYDKVASETSLVDIDEEWISHTLNCGPQGLRAWAGHEGPFDTVPPQVAAELLREAESHLGQPEAYLAQLRARLGVPAAMSEMPTVFDEIKAEMDRQTVEWGGPTHDDIHDPKDWHFILSVQMGKLAESLLEGRQSPRRRIIQIAAVCVAAVESMDRRRSRAG